MKRSLYGAAWPSAARRRPSADALAPAQQYSTKSASSSGDELEVVVMKGSTPIAVQRSITSNGPQPPMSE